MSHDLLLKHTKHDWSRNQIVKKIEAMAARRPSTPATPAMRGDAMARGKRSSPTTDDSNELAQTIAMSVPVATAAAIALTQETPRPSKQREKPASDNRSFANAIDESIESDRRYFEEKERKKQEAARQARRDEKKIAADKALPVDQKVSTSLLGAFVGEEEIALGAEGAAERAALIRRLVR